jgi:hypothetical protein
MKRQGQIFSLVAGLTTSFESASFTMCGMAKGYGNYWSNFWKRSVGALPGSRPQIPETILDHIAEIRSLAQKGYRMRDRSDCRTDAECNYPSKGC